MRVVRWADDSHISDQIAEVIDRIEVDRDGLACEGVRNHLWSQLGEEGRMDIYLLGEAYEPVPLQIVSIQLLQSRDVRPNLADDFMVGNISILFAILNVVVGEIGSICELDVILVLVG